MNIVDFDGQEDKPDSTLAPPGASSSPGSPKKTQRVNFTRSPAGFASTSAAASAERGYTLRRASSDHNMDPRSELGEELSRRLDRIDRKLDRIGEDLCRAQATRFADVRHDRNAGGPQSSAFLDNGRTTALRSTADGGHLINIEPPAEVNALAPAGPGPNVMPPARRSSGESAEAQGTVDRAIGDSRPMRHQSWGLQPRGSVAGSETPAPGSPRGPSPRTSRVSTNSRRGSTLIPNMSSRRPTITRQLTRSTAWTASGRSSSVRSGGSQVPDMFKNQFVARRVYEKSESKDMEHIEKYMSSLPKAMTNTRSKAVDYIYTTLDDPASSNVAWWAAKCLQAFVLLSVLGTFLQTVEDPPLHGRSAAIVETVVDAVFLSEICIRWCCAPSKVNFVFTFHSWIDIAAASALAVRAAVGFVLPESRDDSVSVFLLCFVPIIRLLKILRHFETFKLLIEAVRITLEALPMLLYAVALITMTFATLIYLVEPELFESPFRATWFCLVTVTTVGYGDYTPVTTAGITIVMILIVMGVILMAVPIGIIGNTFNEVWSGRDYSLLLSKTRMKLHQWGYTAHDIPTLFKLVDYDENGVLELDEFCELVKEMKIGLSEDRIITLFDHMDQDGSGGLDAAEFARAVFPQQFVENFGHAGAMSRKALTQLTKFRQSTFSAMTHFTVNSRGRTRSLRGPDQGG
jgi:hypothetical protein